MGITINDIAAMNISYQFFSLEFFLDSVAEIGFKRIDLWTGYPHLVLDEDYIRKCEELRKQCDVRGLVVDNITPKVIGWPLNIAALDEKIRNNAIAYLKRAVDAALILGAPSLQLVPGTGLYDQPIEPAWNASRDSLKEIAAYASKKGVALALEAIQIFESNLVGNCETLTRMLRDVNNAALGAVVDTTHIEKNNETLDDYFHALGTSVKRVHLNESDQLPWGLGTGDLSAHLKALNDFRYNGPVTVEICSKPHYLRPHDAMKQTYEYLAWTLG